MILCKRKYFTLLLGLIAVSTQSIFAQDRQDGIAQEGDDQLISTQVDYLSGSTVESTSYQPTHLLSMTEPEDFCNACTDANSCNSCNPTCWPQLCIDRLSLGGWLEQGFTGNPESSGGNNGPAGTNGPLIFNDQANEYMMNQLYLFLERDICEENCTWDWGGRIDLVYGTDYFFIQSTGLETNGDNSPKWNSGNGPRNAGNAGLYGLALPQAYAEVYSPWAGGVTFKFGHFYTTMGYESVMAPENFFYSHSYAMQYGEPFTHTGGYASWKSNPCVTWHAGFTRGWNTWEQPNGRLGFLGGVSWMSPNEATQIRFALHTGNEDITGQNNRTTYSLVFQQRINCCWTYVMHHNLGVEDDARVNTSNQLDTATWYGLVNYLYYTYDPCLDLGFRFEWFDDRDNARVFGLANDNLVGGGTYYNFTWGANWHPNDWFVLRPELRYDYSDLTAPAITGAFNNGTSDDQFTLGFDCIVLF